MTDHIAQRAALLRTLRRELVGPAPSGEELDIASRPSFPTWAAANGPFVAAGTGEEIITRDSPVKRYGVGVLYPLETPAAPEVADLEPATDAENFEPIAGEPGIAPGAERTLEEAQRRIAGSTDEGDDFDLSAANSHRPSTCAVSFLARLPAGAKVQIEGGGGRYKTFDVTVEGRVREWWVRTPVELRAEVRVSQLEQEGRSLVRPELQSSGSEGLDVAIEMFVRPRGADLYLCTISVVNRSQAAGGGRPDRNCLFQTFLTATLTGSGASILPYQAITRTRDDPEVESLALLYRDSRTFAIGHGCAADWGDVTEGATDRVSIEMLPAVETPSTTADLVDDQGRPIRVRMNRLAGLIAGDDGERELDSLVDAYEAWITAQSARISDLDARHRPAAERHMADCAHVAARMRGGLSLLKGDPVVAQAFRLANHAILLQQMRSRRQARSVRYDAAARRMTFDEPPPEPDLTSDGERGSWRPFQIAFLLATIGSVADPTDPERDTVELIWFPTGGGKTEAYLGLAAFAMFHRRLTDQADAGVDVLMRYTLRLLTAQQFQRAAGLLCAMEHLRGTREDLGRKPFSVGIWLGGGTTPNRRADAISVLRKLMSGSPGAANQFVITKCPWCGAQMGPVAGQGRGVPRVIGYEQRGSTVGFRCPDPVCEFNSELPIYVTDEDIYLSRPSLIIGTVDKFAMLAWRDNARALFGIGADGARDAAPPGLIIQDELHLISGPLGSMVGLYEGVIEELCTDRRAATPVSPKIVSSTATIRRYEEQVRALYARDSVSLFPPRGIDASNSFFARYATNKDGTLRHGRIYVGVHASGLGSVQAAQVRTFSTLLQFPQGLEPAERDPWWTLLAFYNSLRELGGGLSLFQSDIPDYSKVIRERLGLPRMRFLEHILELTGRLTSDEIPAAIEALEFPTTLPGGPPVDACLASNIIEVGIDIDRLSLMAIVGQPKTTSQYIQVSGRVGRSWEERPGLVVTIYSSTKPRDRSHFEQFRSYHDTLYAQVEPTSVTPFAPPVLERALHAAIVSYCRQRGGHTVRSGPWPMPEELIAEIVKILEDRVIRVDPEESAALRELLDRRLDEWRRWERTTWEHREADPEIPLLTRPGDYASNKRRHLSWVTPQSMRNVDAECEAVITSLYTQSNNG